MILSTFKFLLLIAVINPVIISQEKQASVSENLNTLSRYRILVGDAFIVPIDEESSFNIFFNINYRASAFNKTTKPWKIGMAFEAGVNSLINENNFFGTALLPYLKTGPEMVLARNLFLGTSLGLSITVNAYPAMVPFAGLNSFYLIPLNKNLFLEFEAGFHTTFFMRSVLVYITTGIAF